MSGCIHENHLPISVFFYVWDWISLFYEIFLGIAVAAVYFYAANA